HPTIRSFHAWKARHIASQPEVKFHERRQERADLVRLFGAPIEQLLTEEGLLAQYQAHIAPTLPRAPLPPPTCRECRHCAPDRYHPGHEVCWQGGTGGRPKQLTTLTICEAFTDRRPEAQPPSEWTL